MTTHTIEEMVRYGIEEATPFHKHLGIKVEQISDTMIISLEMRDEFIGNFSKGILHGGVTSTLLDLAGGSSIMYRTMQELVDQTQEEKIRAFGKIGTIDLRVDYLRGGRGNKFFASSKIARYGNKIAVTKMELHNEKDVLIATGTGTYIVR